MNTFVPFTVDAVRLSLNTAVTLAFVDTPVVLPAGVVDATVGGVRSVDPALLSAIKSPPFAAEVVIVADPAPVAPAVVFIAQAADTDILKVVCCLSNNSVKAPGEVAVLYAELVQVILVPPLVPMACPKKIIAELVVEVVILVADTAVDVVLEIFPVAASKGLVTSTPEKANMEPELPVAPLPRANV
jgi:hypothetical protein